MVLNVLYYRDHQLYSNTIQEKSMTDFLQIFTNICKIAEESEKDITEISNEQMS